MVALNVLGENRDDQVLLHYRRALDLWCSQVADEMGFGLAAVYANTRLSAIPEANCVLGQVAADQTAPIDAYFATAKTRPLAWYLPESAAGEGMLASLQDRPLSLLSIQSIPPWTRQTHPELTIIPARASFRHVEEIAAVMRPSAPADQAAEAAMCHLDDSRVDAVIALKGGQAAAYACVLSLGDTGFITDLFVHPDLRGRGYSTPMVGHLFDICRRSLFQNILCAVAPDDTAGMSFAQRIGFTTVANALMRA